MNRILKVLCGVACAFAFCFLAIGYAAVQDTLSVIGSVTIERAVTDIIISHEDIDAYSFDPTTGELTIKETYTESTDNENYRVIGILENGFVGYSEAASVISVSIPQSVQTIGDNAFTGCSNLKYFTVDQNNAYFMADNVLFSKVGTSLLRYPPGYKYPTPMLYHIPQDVASINRYAFCDLPAGTVVVTECNGLATSPWGASSPCLILVAPEHYSTIQRFVGNSGSGYTITGDSTVAKTNLVFTNLQSNSRDNREWAAVDENGQFTIPSSICNASGPSVLAVATVIGDINKDQLSADLGDDYAAVIGGGRWTLGLWESLNTTGNDVDLIVNDGYFGGGGINFSKSHTTINGGVFSVYYFVADTRSDGPSSVVINGGEWTYTSEMNFTSLDSSRISVEIKGGTFHWSRIVASSSQHVITGGTFKFDPTSTGYIPNGYMAQNNGNGTWTVVPDTNAAFVNEEETTICSCETKCANPNDACEVCKTDIVLCKGTEVTETTEPESPTGDSPSNGEQGEQPDAGEEQTTPSNDPPADEPSSDDGQSEQPTEGAETTTPSDVSDGDVIEPEETQTPDGQNASESEETSEPVISTDPVILPSEDEEDGEKPEQPQDTENDQQGQE